MCFAFHHREQGVETGCTVLEYECLYPSSSTLATGERCSAQGKVHFSYQNDYFRKADCSSLLCEVHLTWCKTVPDAFHSIIPVKADSANAPLQLFIDAFDKFGNMLLHSDKGACSIFTRKDVFK